MKYNLFIKFLIKYAAIFPLLLSFALSFYYITKHSVDMNDIGNLAILMPAKLFRFAYIAVTGYLLSYLIKEKYTKIIFLATGIFYSLLITRLLYYCIFDFVNYMNVKNNLFWFGNISMLIILVSTLIIKESNGRFNIKKTMGSNRDNCSYKRNG